VVGAQGLRPFRRKKEEGRREKGEGRIKLPNDK
jgi:hypothetical protein